MKFIYVLLLTSFLSANVSAQDEKDNDEVKERGFKKENLFTGGSFNLSFGSYSTSLGISPYFGYSLNKYLDVAVSAGINYISQRQYDDYYGNYIGKIRQTIYGPGAFVRVFPVNFLFAQAQYEYNLIKQKNIYPNNSGLPNERYSTKVSSLLVGAGYAGGREAGNKSFYYLSIMWDVANSLNSPYSDYQGHAVPVIRVGYNFALFQGGQTRSVQRRPRRDNF